MSTFSGRAAVAGVDVGSVAAKAVVLEVGTLRILGRAVLPTGWTPREAGAAALDAACAEAGLTADGLATVVGTGYGRIALPFAQRAVTEITCHARAAAHLSPEARTVCDIGGQDSKIICLDDAGLVQDFAMNDKCAAGTGRFLQVLAGLLDKTLDELSEAAGRGRPASISSMCAVFAESEIVGLLARDVPPEDVAAGVFRAIARRIRQLAGRLPLRGTCVFTGGLAQSPAFGALLEAELQLPVIVPDAPQCMGALGAALLAANPS